MWVDRISAPLQLQHTACLHFGFQLSLHNLSDILTSTKRRFLFLFGFKHTVQVLNKEKGKEIIHHKTSFHQQHYSQEASWKACAHLPGKTLAEEHRIPSKPRTLRL